MELRISVRHLVEFILRSGDIDNRRAGGSDTAMAEGSRIHRMIQRRMGGGYLAEVSLRWQRRAEKGYDITVEGRADGILPKERGFTVDEIKGTYRDLLRMAEPVPVHLAQAKCYGYMYAVGKGCREEIGVRMTYCNMDTEELRYFDFTYTFEELETWFLELMAEYEQWADMEVSWKGQRQDSIHSLQFPFAYREGQKELAAYVYRTICHKRKLFLEAPTGVGKTISTVFPAVKAIGEGKAEKLFYLTAKTITRTVADETFALLRKQGLQFKTVLLTARDKICFLDEAECNPEACAYAKGHYDRINRALFDILTHEVNYSRETIEEYARRHRVCPFEMELDISLFCDGVICDYNYVFDPHVYLHRFFAGGGTGDYLFLIDEAHNLVDRGREMYSASLYKEDFLALRREIKAVDTRIAYHLEKCNKALLALKRDCEDYRVIKEYDSFVIPLTRLHAAMDEFLEEKEGRPEYGELRRRVLEFYFETSHFLEMYELMDENYVVYTRLEEDGRFRICLYCVDPSVNLRACMERGSSSILFSATLLPIQYYKRLLGGEEKDYEVYARSSFDPGKRALLIGTDVTARYARRGRDEYGKIAAYIYEIVKNRFGNYLIFFPSYRFMQEVYSIYMSKYAQADAQECILQESSMNERAREEFLKRFSVNEDWDLSERIAMEIEVEEEKSLLGFCVMGGIFSEGIDLKRDSLIGAVIVGTGIPQVCAEREILKDYFEAREGSGFDYAYRYPGMNKVLQAAGRVIRTGEDIGIIALLDERFGSAGYRRLFPREWENGEYTTVDRIGKRIERFWDEWL